MVELARRFSSALCYLNAKNRLNWAAIFNRVADHCVISETHKELKRVTLICLLCPMLVIIQFRKYHIWNEKKR